MKFSAIIFCLTIGACAPLVSVISQEQASYRYIGDIEFGEPEQTENETVIPMHFSGGLWMHNSGICYKKSEVEIEGHIMTLRIFTSVCDNKKRRPAIILNKPAKGEYLVHFEDPDGNTHQLTEIVIP